MHQTKFAPDHPILAWLAELVPQMLARYARASADGKTPYERRKGKHYKRTLPKFSEIIQYLVGGKIRDKLDDRYPVGCFLGLVVLRC